MSYPGSNELVTTAEVKALSNITVATYDTYIGSVIPSVCRAVETYCGRKFLLNTWIQWVSKDREIFLDNWPINNVLLIGVPYACFTITDTSNKYNFVIQQPTSNNPNTVARFVATNTETLAVTEYLFSVSTTVGALKTAVEAGLVGVTFTYETAPSTITFANLSTSSLRMTSGKTVYIGVNYFDQTSGTSIGDIYRISDNSDRLILNPNYADVSYFLTSNYPYTMDAGYVLDYYNESDTLVIYNSGYATADVPADLKMAVSLIISDLMAYYDIQGGGGWKGIYKSETLGDYSYTIGDGSFIWQLVHKYHDILDHYKIKIIQL